MRTRRRVWVTLGLLAVVALMAAVVVLPGAAAHSAAAGPRPAGLSAAAGPRTVEAVGSPGGRAPTAAVAPRAGWVFSEHDIVAGGRERSYLLARPAPAVGHPVGTGTLPVLVVLHGRMMTPGAMLIRSGFLGQVGAAIVVFPAGEDLSWNAGYCCGGAHAAGVNDVGFLRALVAQVLAQQPGATAGRVYLAGFSNGGRMAYRMACDAPGLFAGVAAVEAVSVSDCSRTTPVPLLIVAQTGDPLLTVNAGAPPKHIAGHTETTVGAEVVTWRGLDGCGPGQATTTLGDLTTQTWNQCHGGARVEEAVYGGGGHSWFRGCASTPSAQGLVWAFFRGLPPMASAVGPRCPPAQSSRLT